MSEVYTLTDTILELMEAQGFQCSGCTGKVGEETVTFKNEAGKVITLQFGFTPAQPKNYKINLKGNKTDSLKEKNMSDKDFVPYEMAKKLKEAGFDWTCQNFHIEKIPKTEREEWDGDECQYATVYDIVKTPIPTLWQAAKWIREVKKIDIDICSDMTIEANRKITGRQYFFTVWDNYKGKQLAGGLFSTKKSYENALSAGIDAALDLINNIKTE